MVRLGLLLGGMLLFWLLVGVPAALALGETHLVYSGVALALCAAPALASLLLQRWASAGSPEMVLAAVVAGMFIRMTVVLGAGLALSLSLPYFEGQAFWFWVLAFYLYTLTLEVILMVWGRSATVHQPTNM